MGILDADRASTSPMFLIMPRAFDNRMLATVLLSTVSSTLFRNGHSKHKRYPAQLEFPLQHPKITWKKIIYAFDVLSRLCLPLSCSMPTQPANQILPSDIGMVRLAKFSQMKNQLHANGVGNFPPPTMNKFFGISRRWPMPLFNLSWSKLAFTSGVLVIRKHWSRDDGISEFLTTIHGADASNFVCIMMGVAPGVLTFADMEETPSVLASWSCL